MFKKSCPLVMVIAVVAKENWTIILGHLVYRILRLRLHNSSSYGRTSFISRNVSKLPFMGVWYTIKSTVLDISIIIASEWQKKTESEKKRKKEEDTKSYISRNVSKLPFMGVWYTVNPQMLDISIIIASEKESEKKRQKER